jgi:carbonic anhydrase/acetyltransferase-like protein (isoleucine patch superfamily)
MGSKKYRLGERHPTQELHRVVALRDFGDVRAGDIGGWIQQESNLSHDGNCWVSGNARVSDNAWVSGNARVSGNAGISGNARVSDNAWVSDNARVYGNARVYYNAWVSGNARVSDNAWVSGNATCSTTPLCISGLEYFVTVTDKHIRIGCQQWALEDMHRIPEQKKLTKEQKAQLTAIAILINAAGRMPRKES